MKKCRTLKVLNILLINCKKQVSKGKGGTKYLNCVTTSMDCQKLKKYANYALFSQLENDEISNCNKVFEGKYIA